MSLERVPISRLEVEQFSNTRKKTALTGLGTNLNNLKTSVAALNDPDLFSGRTAATNTSGSTWSVSADTTSTAGTNTFNVTQLATAAVQRGTTDIAEGISATSDVSGLTLANMATATPVTAGTFTVNGAQVTVDTTDSLQDVFDAIDTATGSAVTAAYDETTDTITLSSGSEIILGAANDTSNFLTVSKLSNNGTGTIESSGGLGAGDINSALVDARLKTAITAVDGAGDGTFSINGVDIAYNVNDDSISDVLDRINDSTAGVTATYDSALDRVNLTNDSTGDIGIGVSESAGGLLGALGLTGGTLDRGVNAEFTVNGGSTLTSTSNTLTADSHGITGLAVSATTTTSQDITVSADTDSAKAAIEDFIAKFNTVQLYIDEQTKITTDGDDVTAGLLSSNREIQTWAQSLRSSVFAEVEGLSGAFSRMESFGIDFVVGENTLEIKDATALDDALRDNADDLAEFFSTADTGFAARLETLVENFVGDDGTGGFLETQTTALDASNKSLDQQIEDAERRLDQKREQMEAGFIAMELAQQRIQIMQQQLSSAFSSISPSSGGGSSSSGNS